MATELDLVNRSLVEIASRQPITSLSDNVQGVYASTIYQAALNMLLRQEDFEFCRTEVVLTPVAGTPALNWTYQYAYPSDCQRVRQVVPETWDQYDPQPVRWDVGNFVNGDVTQTVIWTGTASASLVYSSNNVTVDQMDAGFQEQLVRYMGSILSMSNAGRPDFAQKLLEQAGGIGQAMKDRDS
jgi:hypothetical protein